MAGPTLAPLLIGVTGKRKLPVAEAAVRAALDLIFDRLDARCPHSPKVLLSSLAAGADTIAAEAALARRGWSVVAPLPFSEALYREDFEKEADWARFRALMANPRMRAFVVDPLRRPQGDRAFSDHELSRRRPANKAARDDHYEQAGLLIAERAAILIGVMAGGEKPGKIGGAARIVHHRLTGELDADSGRIVRTSGVLFEPPRLVDRRPGPVWLVDLARLHSQPGAPADALKVWNPGHEAKEMSLDVATRASLTLADGVEGFNRRLGRLGGETLKSIEQRAGPHLGDAASELKRLRFGLSAIQARMIAHVRNSIRYLAGFSLAAILALEIYVDLGNRDFYVYLAWPSKRDWWPALFKLILNPFSVLDPAAIIPLFSGLYISLVAAAVFIYWNVGHQRWQRIAEDYRAAAEALRVQLAWWASGLTRREDRIENFYQHGTRGSVLQLRAFVNQLLDGCALRFEASALDAKAAESWAAGQVDFFDRRIVDRRRELVGVEGAAWFLFAASLAAGISLPFTLVEKLMTLLCAAAAAWSAPLRLVVLTGAVLMMALLLVAAIQARRLVDERKSESEPEGANLPVWIFGFAAGFILIGSLCVVATFFPPRPPEPVGIRPIMKLAKELIGIAVIMPAAIAGALRFIAEKSSWAAELTGYEHACGHFKRGHAALVAAGGFEGAAAGEHRAIILALGAEALSENENWLRAHRERPLEPIVGG